MAGYQVACALLRRGQVEQAEQFAVRLAGELGGTSDQTILSHAGALWLIAAVSTARRTEGGVAWEVPTAPRPPAGLLAGPSLGRQFAPDAAGGWSAPST
jgi:hypothetical protein